MYPELFTIPWINYPVSTFGLMVALAFLLGGYITAHRMGEEGLDPDDAWTILIYVMLGGLAGSKLYFSIDVHLREGAPFSALLFSRAGITWYGGLIGGTLVGAIGCRIHGVPIVTFANCTAIAGALGQAVGRVGCFLVGDDYGRVSDLPWAVAFPRGAPPTLDTVHPTQLYEVAWLLPVAAFLWLRRRSSPFLFGEYIALAGVGRIAIENWRVNQPVAFGLTEPQLIGVAMIVAGLGGWVYFARSRRRGEAGRRRTPARPARREGRRGARELRDAFRVAPGQVGRHAARVGQRGLEWTPFAPPRHGPGEGALRLGVVATRQVGVSRQRVGRRALPVDLLQQGVEILGKGSFHQVAAFDQEARHGAVPGVLREQHEELLAGSVQQGLGLVEALLEPVRDAREDPFELPKQGRRLLARIVAQRPDPRSVDRPLVEVLTELHRLVEE
jgi:phosphatidylglycerol:prolipoprotein diacylglycerol transferase